MMTDRDLPPTLQRLKELFFVLEELLKRIADTEDPNIRRLRAKVRAELVAIQSDMSGVDAPV
jgi:ElaB/YqjD/DUF883 family membrane-anchored ribosome-binding protein